MGQPSQEYLRREFMHYIGDTLAILGAEEDFVKKIKSFEEIPLTASLIEEIRKFNTLHIDKVKTRLALLNAISVRKD